MDDVYLAIGNGKTPPNSVINIITKEDETVPKVVKVSSKQIDKDVDIIVSGIDKVKVNLANCCCPVFGDEIVGYITKGSGITIHRINCHNLEMLEDRTVDVSWNSSSNKKYITNLLIHTNTLENHMMDLMQALAVQGISLDSFKTLNKNLNILYEVSCYVTSVESIDKIIMNLTKLSYVEKVEREMR